MHTGSNVLSPAGRGTVDTIRADYSARAEHPDTRADHTEEVRALARQVWSTLAGRNAALTSRYVQGLTRQVDESSGRVVFAGVRVPPETIRRWRDVESWSARAGDALADELPDIHAGIVESMLYGVPEAIAALREEVRDGVGMVRVAAAGQLLDRAGLTARDRAAGLIAAPARALSEEDVRGMTPAERARVQRDRVQAERERAERM